MLNKFPETPSNPEPGEKLPGSAMDGSAENDDDSHFVRLAREGNPTAYEELVNRHRARVFAMIRNMIHQEAEAWDLSQEVFIKAWQALPRFESKARFSTWLYRITHNVVCDWTRRHRIEAVGELNDGMFERERIDVNSRTTPFAAEAPDDSLAHGELRARIEDALAKISAEHREVVLLKDVQGLSYQEIAETVGCSIGTVMSRLHYARQKLQSLLKDAYESR